MRSAARTSEERRLEPRVSPGTEDEPPSRCRERPYSLSEREFRVLYLLVEGLPDRQIAAALGVTIYTVNKHVGAILLKMRARSRTAAAVRAVREQIFADAAIGTLAAEQGP